MTSHGGVKPTRTLRPGPVTWEIDHRLIIDEVVRPAFVLELQACAAHASPRKTVCIEKWLEDNIISHHHHHHHDRLIRRRRQNRRRRRTVVIIIFLHQWFPFIRFCVWHSCGLGRGERGEMGTRRKNPKNNLTVVELNFKSRGIVSPKRRILHPPTHLGATSRRQSTQQSSVDADWTGWMPSCYNESETDLHSSPDVAAASGGSSLWDGWVKQLLVECMHVIVTAQCSVGCCYSGCCCCGNRPTRLETHHESNYIAWPTTARSTDNDQKTTLAVVYAEEQEVLDQMRLDSQLRGTV